MKTFPNLLLMCLLGAVTANSNATVISFSDPTGDHTGMVDVTQMSLDFDASGDYSIDITASASAPFTGAFRININLWNATLNEFFQSTFHDFDLGMSQTSINLTGNSGIITDWLPGHAIATTTLNGLGNPPGSTFFRSSVADLPFQSTCVAEDIIGYDGCRTSIPEPTTLALMGLGLAGIGYRRRHSKRAA